MLNRRAPIRRTSIARCSGTGSRTVRPPRRDTGPSRDVRAEVEARFLGQCARCGGRGESIQHRKPRRAGGTLRPEINWPSNLVLVCGSGTTGCHGYMERERTESHRNGWLLHDSEIAAEAPLLLWDGRWVLLPDDGGWVETTPEEASPL